MSTRTAPADYELADFFVVRAPLLPFGVLVEWATGLQSPGAEGEAFESAVAQDRLLLTRRLQALFQRPDLREAVFCASPTLDEALELWLSNAQSPRAAGVATILTRYLSRMAGRATPFGLFSSCGVGSGRGGPTLLTIAQSATTRHTRIDMQYLTTLVQALENDPAVRAGLHFFPSNGFHRLGDRIHHAEVEMRGDPPARAYRLVSLDAGQGTDLALRAAASGATVAEIAARMTAADANIDLDSALAFVGELVECQLLVSELSPPITGVEPLVHVIEVLERRAVAGEVTRRLVAVREHIERIDRDGLGQNTASYRAVAELLGPLPAPVEASRLFQVDLVRDASSSCLGADLQAELARAVALLKRIATPIATSDLATFAKAFSERYEGAEVPLLEALDDETGIGFGKTSSVPTDLLDGLTFPSVGPPAPVAFDAREQWLADRLQALAGAGQGTWELAEEDLAALETKQQVALPAAGAVMLSIGAASAEALANGDCQLLIRGIEAGGTNLLGRFCHGDPALHRAVLQLVKKEEQLAPDRIFAEIVHQPEGRVGNILCRPVLRDYEIPYLARSGVDEAHRIPIEDLMVSVQQGKVRLRSKRHDRWVEVRMSTAHNPQTISLGIYRFLCAVRTEPAEAYPAWSWGPLRDLPHLPRVTSGKTILELAQWTLKAADLKALALPTGPARLLALRALRRRLALPRWVALVDGDNVLPIDLDNPLFCDSFLDLMKARKSATLTEVFPPPGDEPVVGPAGRHTVEIVAPFIAAGSAAPTSAMPIPTTLVRSFSPGSSWLYAKVYCGHAMADAALREVVAPLVGATRADGSADGWFFIRYNDPHPHLRVRFRGPADRLLTHVLPALHEALAPWIASRRVHRLQLDTYVRELERYGGDLGMEPSEALFEADSDAVLGIVASFDGVADAEVRWRAALLGMDRSLSDLGFDLHEKLALLREVREAFASEHAVDTAFERQLGARYRAVRSEVEAILAGRAPQSLATAVALFDARSERGAAACRELRRLSQAEQLRPTIYDIAASYLHMHANRLLAADQRAQELVLYDFLLRAYESRAARDKRGGRVG